MQTQKGSVNNLNYVLVERWLNELAARGRLLESARRGAFEFQDGEPGAAAFRIVRNTKALRALALAGELGELGETRLVAEVNGWAILRFAPQKIKPYPDEQDKALAQTNRVVLGVALVSVLFMLGWGIVQYVGELRQRHTLSGMGMQDMLGFLGGGSIAWVLVPAALLIIGLAMVVPAAVRLKRAQQLPPPGSGEETEE